MYYCTISLPTELTRQHYFGLTDVLRTHFLCRQMTTCPLTSISIGNWQNKEGQQQNQPVMQVKKFSEYNLHACVLDVASSLQTYIYSQVLARGNGNEVAQLLGSIALANLHVTIFV